MSPIICEKLKSTPGKVSSISCDSSAVSDSFVIPRGHSSYERRGAKISTLLKPVTSVPSSGRPTCDTADSTTLWVRFWSVHGPLLGQPRTIARMRFAYSAAFSREIEVGRVARIQRLPSSSFGIVSEPSPRAAKPAPARPAATTTTVTRGKRAPNATSGWYARLIPRMTRPSRSSSLARRSLVASAGASVSERTIAPPMASA